MEQKQIRIVALISLLAFFGSCKKETLDEPEMGYGYNPVEIGKWVEYSVTEIEIDDAVNHYDTTNYFLKEIIESEYTDNEGRPSLRIERYWRTSDTLPWVIKDVWFATRTKRTFEKIEENERYLRFVYPVNEDVEWNGNVYNLLNEWDYHFENIDATWTSGTLSVPHTVKVLQRNNFNFVEYEQAWEIYADGIGLVEKHFVDLDINNGDPSDIRLGTILYQTAIAYGSN